jgi:uncharacterized protein (DUF1697 family)
MKTPATMQNKYAIFLRGVNVGGHAAISMEKLKKILSENGFTNVRSYINSGNLVASSALEKGQASERISMLISEYFNMQVDIQLKTKAELEHIIENDRFDRDSENDPSRKVVIMLTSTVNEKDWPAIQKLQVFEEKCYFTDDLIFVYYPQGAGKSRFTTNSVERKLKVKATGRNWNTIIKMIQLLNE